jgi:hypothetical protein
MLKCLCHTWASASQHHPCAHVCVAACTCPVLQLVGLCCVCRVSSAGRSRRRAFANDCACACARALSVPACCACAFACVCACARACAIACLLCLTSLLVSSACLLCWPPLLASSACLTSLLPQRVLTRLLGYELYLILITLLIFITLLILHAGLPTRLTRTRRTTLRVQGCPGL